MKTIGYVVDSEFFTDRRFAIAYLDYLLQCNNVKEFCFSWTTIDLITFEVIRSNEYGVVL